MRALDAVLIPPQRARLAAILGLPDLQSVELVASGWHRFAILAPECVVLLPRSRRWVPGMEREAAALRLLEQYDVAAPRLLARISDEELWADPVTLISRYHARSWTELETTAGRAGWETMLAGLAELIAGVPSRPAPSPLSCGRRRR